MCRYLKSQFVKTFVCALSLVFAPEASAQRAESRNDSLAALLAFPEERRANFNAQGTMFVVSELDWLSRDEVSAPRVHASFGLTFDVLTGQVEDLPAFELRWAQSILVFVVGRSAPRSLRMPAGLTASFVTWAPDGKKFAFLGKQSGRVTPWVVDTSAKELQAKSLGIEVSQVAPKKLVWSDDSQNLIVAAKPNGIDNTQLIRSVASPRSQEANVVTIEDKLKVEPHLPKYLLENLRAIPTVVNISAGRSSRLGAARLLGRMSFAPSGKYVLVEEREEPNAATSISLRRLNGRLVWKSDAGSASRFNGLAWLPQDGDTLAWLESAPGQSVSIVKFDVSSRQQTRTDLPISGELVRTFGNVSGPMLVKSSSGEESLYDPAMPVDQMAVLPASLSDCGPGCAPWPASDSGPLEWVERKSSFVVAQSVSESPPKLFVRRLSDGGVSTLWSPGRNERAVKYIESSHQVIFERTGDNGAQNFFSIDVRGGQATPLTHFSDPVPGYGRVEIRTLHYRAADGGERNITLYLPPNYEAIAGKLPALMWVYPRACPEAGSCEKPLDANVPIAGHPTYRPLRDPSTVNGDFGLAQLQAGYAVIRPDIAVTGPDGGNRGTYLDQMIRDATEIKKAVVATGLIAPDRIAIGGHSRGGNTALLLAANTDLFKVVVSISGPTNFTEYPLPFQNEKRNMWINREVFVRNSPIFFADKIKLPTILVHGLDDGPFHVSPIDSQSMFLALQENGTPVRLVEFPGEGHLFQSKENILDSIIQIAD